MDATRNALYDHAARLTVLDRVRAVTYTNEQQGWLLTAASLQSETRQYNGRGQMTRQTFNEIDIQYVCLSVKNGRRAERRAFSQPGISEEVSYAFEGLNLRVHEYSAEKATIAHGHLVLKGEGFGADIAEPRAAGLLRPDAAEAIQAVQGPVKVELTGDQFDGLVSFPFNLGRGELAKSTLLANMNSGKAVTEVYVAFWNKAGEHESDWLLAWQKSEFSAFTGET